jgi:diaminopimelate decarboxylase
MSTDDSGLSRGTDGVLRMSGAPLDDLLRDAAVGTPAYVYDLDAIAAQARALVAALGERGLCCFAIKANDAAPIARTLLREGCGVDVVSGGELAIALACGAAAARIVYSGVAKRDDELDLAIGAGIRAIHAESIEELGRIAARARAVGGRARVGLRVNPSVEADTHAHIATGHDEAKFGIAREDLPRAFDAIRANAELSLVGMSSHVGSMLMTTAPYVEALSVLVDVARDVRARGFALEYLDAGGGFGVPYRDDQQAVSGAEFVRAARATLDAAGMGDLALLIEPGRSLVAAHGVLLTQVIQPKRSSAGGVARRWLLVDAGMNDLIRPALYQAHHRIVPVRTSDAPLARWRVAGPVCESSDDFGEHPLPDPPPSLLAIREAGAYGRSMASTYNARPIASEVFVSGGRVASVRRAQTVAALVDEQTRD